MTAPSNSETPGPNKSTTGMSDKPVSDMRRERREIDVSTLFNGDKEVFLRHRGEAYSLRITANGKLILTK